ncbi:ATP-binding protein [Kocuria sp. cx-455]|uniref:ATP-binding protein n=1 Tax=Kocuria sp. cx-455 TaxID=2771377 RepID=UPI001686EDC5|nr:ATP-binding protein [Kocuria sp. cx-455]
MDYLCRSIDQELDELLPQASAIALDGPKGVGKSGTAVRRADKSWFLDDPAQLALLEADPTFTAAPNGTLLIDEWQRLPRVWDSVRRQVDNGAGPGRFLLTGSASPNRGVDTHSGAGRILSLRMRPMGIHERGRVNSTVSFRDLLNGELDRVEGETSWRASDYFTAIVESGFPGIMRQTPRVRRAQLDSYIQRIIDRDLPEQGHVVRRPETLRRWLAAYAAAASTTTAYSKILDASTAGDGSQPAKTTTLTYRDLLKQLWILDPVPGWTHSRNPLTRVQQAPKHQLADPALAARLLGLSADLLGSDKGADMAGPLFESLATLSVRIIAQAAEATVGHVRTKNGDHEVDLVAEGPEGQVVGIEVKLAAAIDDSDTRHLKWLREKLPDDVVDLVVLYTGSQAYRRRDGIAVVPLALLGP